jgi:dTDP-4-dehydrorhamnose 3,5-epimerase-like enzyme
MNLEQVKLIEIPSYEDTRGVLTSIEQNQDIPIDIKRIFYMHHILEDRGGHAHIDTDQFIISIFGSFNIKVSDESSSLVFSLNNPKQGLYVPRLVFIEMYDFSQNAVCLVLANTKYDINKSLRTKNDLLSFIKKHDQ